MPEVRSLVGPDMIIDYDKPITRTGPRALTAGQIILVSGPIFATKTKEDVVAPRESIIWIELSRHADLPFGHWLASSSTISRGAPRPRCCSLVSELVGAPDIRARVAAVRNAMREGMVG